MKCELKIRKLEARDMSDQIRFPEIDDNKYQFYVMELLESLNSIETVTSINEKDGTVTIESILKDQSEFWDSVKDLFEKNKEKIHFSPLNELT